MLEHVSHGVRDEGLLSVLNDVLGAHRLVPIALVQGAVSTLRVKIHVQWFRCMFRISGYERCMDPKLGVSACVLMYLL